MSEPMVLHGKRPEGPRKTGLLKVDTRSAYGTLHGTFGNTISGGNSRHRGHMRRRRTIERPDGALQLWTAICVDLLDLVRARKVGEADLRVLRNLGPCSNRSMTIGASCGGRS